MKLVSITLYSGHKLVRLSHQYSGIHVEYFTICLVYMTCCTLMKLLYGETCFVFEVFIVNTNYRPNQLTISNTFDYLLGRRSTGEYCQVF